VEIKAVVDVARHSRRPVSWNGGKLEADGQYIHQPIPALIASSYSSRSPRDSRAKGAKLHYEPKPIDTSKVVLPDELLALTERLAENAHDIWAIKRLHEGWTYGPQRDDAAKKHPDLVPYANLPESEKNYDRNAAMETLKAIVALGYGIARSQ